MMKRIGELKADLAKMTAWGRGLEHDKRLLQEENARLNAECQARQAENSVLAIECDSLKAEVERLKGIILAQSSEFVRNATKQEEEPLPDGWNSSVAKACDLLAEKDKDYARLKSEVERLTSDLQMEKENEDRLVREWQKANNEVYGLKTQVAALIDDQTRLKAEVERLTKAGDAMADRLIYQGYPETVPAWNAAKEGRSHG